MNTVRRLLMIAAITFTPFTTIWAQVTVCDGESVGICGSMVVADGSSVAANASEADTLSPDDPLGEPTITSEGENAYEICIEISNDGGDLSGPNGVVQNGGLEGGCIEVQLEIHITITTTVTIGPISVTSATVRTLWTDPVEVCPC